MNYLSPLVLGLSSPMPDEVHITSFVATVVVLTLIVLLCVSFYTLRLVVDLKQKVILAPKPSFGPEALEKVQTVAAPVVVSATSTAADYDVPPQVFAAIAAAVQVVCGKSVQIVALEAHPVELQELQAWSHAGRLHLHDHRVA